MPASLAYESTLFGGTTRYCDHLSGSDAGR